MAVSTPALPVVGSAALIVPRSMCNHSARTDQFADSISSAPKPATQPPFVVFVLDDAKSVLIDSPQPSARQSIVRPV